MSQNKSTIPKDPTALAEEWHHRGCSHLQAWEKVRLLCCTKIDQLVEKQENGFKGADSREMVDVVKCLKEAIAGERDALSMEYQDVNRAVGRVKQLGFLITTANGVEIDPMAIPLEGE